MQDDFCVKNSDFVWLPLWNSYNHNSEKPRSQITLGRHTTQRESESKLGAPLTWPQVQTVSTATTPTRDLFPWQPITCRLEGDCEQVGVTVNGGLVSGLSSSGQSSIRWGKPGQFWLGDGEHMVNAGSWRGAGAGSKLITLTRPCERQDTLDLRRCDETPELLLVRGRRVSVLCSRDVSHAAGVGRVKMQGNLMFELGSTPWR